MTFTNFPIPTKPGFEDLLLQKSGEVATDRGLAQTAAQSASDNAGLTASDRTATGQDRVQTGLDAQATAADRVQTGLDRAAAEQAAASLLTALGDINDVLDAINGEVVE